jgi:hypothetical protein
LKRSSGGVGFALALFLPEALVESGHFRQHFAGRRLESAQVELEAQVVEFLRAAAIVAQAEPQARVDPLRPQRDERQAGQRAAAGEIAAGAAQGLQLGLRHHAPHECLSRFA